MKTLTLDIIKKNRKFFAVRHNGYECKLVIDEASESLELGKQELLVDDVSVRTKYGTDVIYKLHAAAAEQKEAGICTLIHSYNQTLIEKCRELGGRFDQDAKAWVFSSIVADKVEELDALYNNDHVTVEITAIDARRGSREPLRVVGYTLATAYGRDSGAKVAEEVALIEGRVDSGGSMKNRYTVAHKGSKFRLKMSRAIAATIDTEKWAVAIID
jgi:hypothetical protein